MRHHVRRERSALVLALLTTLACGREEAREGKSQEPKREVQVVLAKVGDEVVGASDVAELMRSKGLDRRAALDELLDEAVLVHEARERGISESAAQRRAVERVMVRQMLKDFESELTPEKVPREVVETNFNQHREKFQLPERRASWHILVKDSSDAGKRLADSILREARNARDPRDVYERYASGAVETELDVVAEELPAISRAAGFDEPYKDALFFAETRGVLDGPVETKYGWHVIVLTDILPGEDRQLEDVEPEIRERLSQKMRFEKVARTVGALEEQGLVEYDDDGVDRLLSMSGLPTRAEP